MRPHRLSLQAFGAYAGAQSFDLDELGDHRLFLIQGPTGSGKTTLLDAICFALFGESSGEERDGAGMRSHHAEAAAETWVELDFALGETRYRVRRSPAQRTERRGRMADRLPEAALFRIGEGQPELLAEKLREVNERVAALLGYTATEFRQVVLLPQGRFRELLTAGPRERQEILAKLFRSETFRRVQDRLAEMARGAKSVMDSAATARATLLAEAGAETLDAATEASIALAGTATTRAGLAEAASLALRASTASRDAARADARSLLERDTAAAALAALEAEAPARMDRARRLDEARRADALSGEAAAELAARQAAERGAALVDAAAEALEQGEREHAAAEAALADAGPRAQAQAEATAQAEMLTTLTTQAESLAKGEAKLREAEAASVRAIVAQDRAVADQAQAQGGAQAAEAEHRRLAALAERLEERRSAAERAKRAAKDAELLAGAATTQLRLARAAEITAEAATAAGQTLREATEAELHAERLAWATQAATLAAGLVSGAACPVCGGTHHPEPARAPDGVAGDLALHRARSAAAREAEYVANQAATKAAAAAHAAATLRDDLAARVAEAGPPDEAAQRLAEESMAAAAALPALEARLATAYAALAATNAALEAARSEAEATRTRRDGMRGSQAALRSAVPEAARDSRRLAQLIAEARGRATALGDALQADRTRHDRAAAALAERRQALVAARLDAAVAAQRARDSSVQLREACGRAGFADSAALAAARMEAHALTSLATSVEQHAQALHAARTRHDRAAAAVLGLAMPDLAALEEAAARAEAAAVLARDEATEARAEAARHAALCERLKAADAAWLASGQRHHLLDRMSRVLRGDNRLRRDLEGHVLAGLLEETLEAANRHLGHIFQHRYRLAMREDPANRRAAAGLDIEVWDDWTGQPRAAGTLSGGEGFCAALALALGLSEVVQARAGAVRIEALFVDEGFGTLDPEALDQALEVLAGLENGGRLIGIISHVPELKARIPAQLRVTPGPRGSTARFAFA